MNGELIAVLEYLQREKGIDKEVLIEAVEQALLQASKKSVGPAREVRIEIDRKTGQIRALAKLLVVEHVTFCVKRVSGILPVRPVPSLNV